VKVMAAVTITAALLGTGIVVSIDRPDSAVAQEESPQPPEVQTVVVTEVSKECVRFGNAADSFVRVTSDYMAAMNEAVEAQGDFDQEAMGDALLELEEIVDRLDEVSERYAKTRDGCF
jgi:hypothetical protein